MQFDWREKERKKEGGKGEKGGERERKR